MTGLKISFLTMTTSPALAFAEWMSARRQQLGITLDQLETKTGIKKQHLSVLERATPHSLTGKPVVPKRATVEKIAKGMGASVNAALAAAGYVSVDTEQSEADKLAAELARWVMASGYDKLEDPVQKEAYLEDMKTISDSMLRRRLEEQAKKNR